MPQNLRSVHEEGMRAGGFPDYSITERTTDNGLVDAGEREQYFPIAFIAPL